MDINLSENIRKFHKERRLTQQLADALNVKDGVQLPLSLSKRRFIL